MLSHNLTTTTVTPLHPLKNKGGVITMVSYDVTPRNARNGVTLVLWHSWAQYVKVIHPLILSNGTKCRQRKDGHCE